MCDLAAECATVFAVAFSFEQFKKVPDGAHTQIFGKSYWVAAAMFVAALIQQKMQAEDKNKGHTVLICDDNKQEMTNLSDALYKADPWFDPIYQKSKKTRGKLVWQGLSDEERFDQIINTAFAIKSEHSSLVQMADAASYIYRRHLELKGEAATWEGEQKYFAGLAAKLEWRRQGLGRTPGGPCIEFYQTVRHKEWKL